MFVVIVRGKGYAWHAKGFCGTTTHLQEASIYKDKETARNQGKLGHAKEMGGNGFKGFVHKLTQYEINSL